MKRLSPFGNKDESGLPPSRGPIEPGGAALGRLMWIKWVLLLIFILYMVVSYFYAPILVEMGKFLVVKDQVERSELLVCLMGQPVERGLEAADLYHLGLTGKVFFAREALPDGFDALRERGVDYPETYELLHELLLALGVPAKAIMLSEGLVDSTMDEALVVRSLAKRSGIKSIIVVTSPTHTRRALMAFRKALKGMEIKISIVPSSYSGFDPMNWWKEEKYVQEVLMEYLKLMYYFFKYK